MTIDTQSPLTDVDEIRKGLALIRPAGVVELRALKVPTGSGSYTRTHAGFFDEDHNEDLIAAAVRLSDMGAKGVYMTPNPVNPELLARRANRTDVAETGELTKGGDVTHIVNRYIDIDSSTPVSGVPATADEVEAAVAVGRAVVKWLTSEFGFPQPRAVIATGNGVHLHYTTDIEPEQGAALWKSVLLALGARFNSADATIDPVIFNPDRIARLTGTWNRRGDGTAERPHRMSRVLSGGPKTVVETTLIERLAAMAPVEPERAARSGNRPGADEPLADQLARWGVAYNRTEAANGGTKYLLSECPWKPGETDGGPIAIEFQSGARWAGCFHAKCAGKGWSDLRALHETAPMPSSGGVVTTNEGVSGEGSYNTFYDEKGGFGSSYNKIPMEPLPDFPLDVFPKAISDYIKRGAKSIGIVPDFIGVPMIPYIAGVMGNSHYLHIKDGWDVWPTFWTCIIAETGTGKTPGGEKASAPVQTLQAEAAQEFDQEIAMYDDAMRLSKKDQNFSAPANRPFMEQFITTDITTEALADALQHGTGITVFKDELAGWVTSFDAYRSKGGDRQNYMSMWSNTLLKTDRKGKDSIVIQKPVVNVTGGIQPEQLNRLDDEVSAGDGFLPRILFSHHPGARPPGWTDDVLPTKYLERVTEIIRPLRLPISDGFNPVSLAPEALSEFRNWVGENAEAQEGTHPFVRAVYAKYPTHCARFALVLHCLNHPVRPSSIPVSKDTMLQAITLTEYFRDHATSVMKLFAAVGALTTAPLTGLRARVYNAVKRDEPEWVTAGEIRKRAGRASQEEKDAMLASLVEDGFIEKQDVTTDETLGGRPTAKYRIKGTHHESVVTTPETPQLNVNPVVTTPPETPLDVVTTPQLPWEDDDKPRIQSRSDWWNDDSESDDSGVRL